MDQRILDQLKKLNTDKSHPWPEAVKGQAPHKPFLLLSIANGIEQGWIKNNRIELSQNLIDTFYTYWNAIMGEDKMTSIALPFYHMKSEPFWELEYKQGKKEYAISPSIGGLKDRVAFSVMNRELFQMMEDSFDKLRIRKLLAETYFSEDVSKKVKEISSFNLQAWDYADKIESMASEPFFVDHFGRKQKKIRKSYTQIREAGFSLAVRKNYKHTCAVCRNRIITPEGQTLVEGAHIIPWSQSNNDDPRNGISLCRSHHWMFDSMMITVKPDYTIRLSKWLRKDENRAEETLQWDRREIVLPRQSRFMPSAEALDHHNDRFETYHKEH